MLTPKDEVELAQMVRDAAGPLAVRGGGTRGMQVAGTGLTTAGLTGITLHEPGALTVVARAGTPVAEVEAALAGANQRLAFEPMDHRPLLGTAGTPTIGGVVAANVSGPRRIAVGAARDFMLGLRYVDGQGTIVKNGGRVMKNVTGYDLVRLLTGSHGTLGVITEVSLKVLPRPETETTLVLPGQDIAAAVAAMSAALGSPFEVTGAAHVAAGGRTLLRLEGFWDSVAYRMGRLRDLLRTEGEVLTDDASAAAWVGLRDVTAFAGAPGDVWRVSVKPSDAPGIVARMGGGVQVQLDWGGGLIWALAPAGTDLRARIGAFSGHATLVRADAVTRAALPVFQPEAAPVAALSAGLRAQFDPREILNPGLMAA
jgi:glycolate oxidase FAD binding subunit